MTKFEAGMRHWILVIALLLALYSSYLLVAPYVGAIVLAFVLSLLCFPVHQYIEQKIPGRPNLVAIISCALLVVVILVPASLVFMAIVKQGVMFTKQSYQWLDGGGAEQLLQHPFLQSALEKINQVLPTEQISAASIVQKLTEIGIDEIIPLTPTRFSVVKWDAARAEKLLERLQRVAREAAMQSRRVWLPKVCGVTPLASVLTQYSASLAEPGGKPVDGNDRCVVIGPEGGFAPEELEQCTKRVSLGESILRAETAAIVAGALMTRCRRGEM